MPPLSETPPMTAAAIAVSSRLIPEFGGGGADPGNQHHAGDTRDRPHQDEAEEDGVADVYARVHRRLVVRSHKKGAATELGPGHGEVEDDHDGGNPKDRVGQPSAPEANPKEGRGHRHPHERRAREDFMDAAPPSWAAVRCLR